MLEVYSNDPRRELLLGQELLRLDKLEGRIETEARTQEHPKATIPQSPPTQNEAEIPFALNTGCLKTGIFVQWVDNHRISPMGMLLQL